MNCEYFSFFNILLDNCLKIGKILYLLLCKVFTSHFLTNLTITSLNIRLYMVYIVYNDCKCFFFFNPLSDSNLIICKMLFFPFCKIFRASCFR